MDLAQVLKQIEMIGHKATPPAAQNLNGVGWLKDAPADYLDFIQHFGGSAVEVFNWTLPAVARFGELRAAFTEGGPPARLSPFAEQDGTWFMAFDLSGDTASIVEWDHEELAAKPFDGTFTDWLAAQLHQEAEIEKEEAQAAEKQRLWAVAHIPFCETQFGRQAALQLGAPTDSRTELLNILLDLHLQYTFQPHVVENRNIYYAGLLHFTDDAIGCWLCGQMNAPSVRACTKCGEPLLLGTHAGTSHLPRHTCAHQEHFGVWAAQYINFQSLQPTVVLGTNYGQSTPHWARLTTFGGTRDPRVVADQERQEWDPPAGDTI